MFGVGVSDSSFVLGMMGERKNINTDLAKQFQLTGPFPFSCFFMVHSNIRYVRTFSLNGNYYLA